MSADMKAAYEFTRELRGLVPWPARDLAGGQLDAGIVPTGAYYQIDPTLTKAEIEIVTKLTTRSLVRAVRQSSAPLWAALDSRHRE